MRKSDTIYEVLNISFPQFKTDQAIWEKLVNATALFANKVTTKHINNLIAKHEPEPCKEEKIEEIYADDTDEQVYKTFESASGSYVFWQADLS